MQLHREYYVGPSLKLRCVHDSTKPILKGNVKVFYGIFIYIHYDAYGVTMAHDVA